MAQDTGGLKASLSNAAIYDFVQNALGARRARRIVSAQYIRATPGALILDVGCGTGEMLEFLPSGVHYVGFDMSEPYITSAKTRYGEKARFECMDVAHSSALGIVNADVALAFGLLHHLDDAEVIRLLIDLKNIVRPGGRVVTVDPTLFEGQNTIASFLAKRDRGRNVRSPTDYALLVRSVFSEMQHEVRSDLLRIPYSHCVMQMTRATQ